MTTKCASPPGGAPQPPAAVRRWRPAVRGRLIVAALGSGLIYGLYLAVVAFLPYGLDRPNLYLFDRLGYGGGAPALYAAAVIGLFVFAAMAWEATGDVGRGTAPPSWEEHQRRPGGAPPSRDDDRRLLLWALAPPVVFALMLTLTQPLTSRDLFHYIMEGRVLGTHAANPYLFPPAAFPRDPLLPYTNWTWANYTSPYGPLWLALGAGLTLLAGDNLFWSVIGFKLVALVGFLACGALVWAILRRLGRSPLPGTVLWLWNPLVLLEFPGAGHNDVLMLAGMLLGVWLVLAGRPRSALVALTVAALVKYVALPLLPLVVWHYLRPLPGWWARARRGAQLLWLPGLLFAGALAPFWVGPSTLGPLNESAHYYASFPHLLRIGLEWFLDYLLAGRIVRGGIVLCLAGGYVLCLREAGGSREHLVSAAAHAMLLLLLLWSFFVPWYVGWAAALVAALGRRRLGGQVLLLSATATLSYLFQLYLPARAAVSVEFRSALSALLTFVPFLLTFLPWATRRASDSQRESRA